MTIAGPLLMIAIVSHPTFGWLAYATVFLLASAAVLRLTGDVAHRIAPVAAES